MGKASTKATDKYNSKAYEDIRLRVKTGQKAIIEAYAKEHNQSTQGFITEAINKAMGVS
jgi:uncharacterized protein (DUF1778 family)